MAEKKIPEHGMPIKVRAHKLPMKKLALSQQDIEVLIRVLLNSSHWSAPTQDRIDSIYRSLVELRESYDDGPGF